MDHETIALGVEAKMFLDSDLARFIVEVADGRVQRAQTELSSVDPTDVSAIVRLQREVRIYGHFLSTLHEIVAAGDSAYQMYLANIQGED